MSLDGGADRVGGPTYIPIGRSEGIFFYVYALKSILVHSETSNIILKTIRANYTTTAKAVSQ